jgi:two-component sensor histidine kinase/ActR/RegA family two-component response regulator
MSPEAFAASIEGRVTAMARAHSVLAAEHWAGVDLQTIAEGEIATYGGSVQIEGPLVRLTPAAAQPIGLVLHELVTNAVKYGALSWPGGTVQLSWEFQIDGGLRLRWVESGGPAITAEPIDPGFGSRLISSLAERQLGGILQRHWLPTGLVLTLTLPPVHAQATPKAPGQPPAETRRQKSLPRLASSSTQGLTMSDGRAPQVLVVEDEALLVMELEQAVRALGCQVIGPARSLAEAVQFAAGEPRPDAAVLDVNLAGEMVFPAADILTTRGVPVLFATGYGSASTLAGRHIKAAAVLRKPYSAKLLADALGHALLLTRNGIAEPPSVKGL